MNGQSSQLPGLEQSKAELKKTINNSLQNLILSLSALNEEEGEYDGFEILLQDLTRQVLVLEAKAEVGF